MESRIIVPLVLLDLGVGVEVLVGSHHHYHHLVEIGRDKLDYFLLGVVVVD